MTTRYMHVYVWINFLVPNIYDKWPTFTFRYSVFELLGLRIHPDPVGHRLPSVVLARRAWRRNKRQRRRHPEQQTTNTAHDVMSGQCGAASISTAILNEVWLAKGIATDGDTNTKVTAYSTWRLMACAVRITISMANDVACSLCKYTHKTTTDVMRRPWTTTDKADEVACR